MNPQHFGIATLILVCGLLVMAALEGLTGLWVQFWLALGLNLAFVFPRRAGNVTNGGDH